MPHALRPPVSVTTEREFRLPGRSRVPVWVWVLALAIHVPLAFLLITRHRNNAAPPFTPRGLTLSDSVRTVPLPALQRGGASASPPKAAPRAISAPDMTPTVVSPSSTATAILPMVTDTPPTRAPSDLHPHYGDGRLWVRPLAESPRQIAKALTGKSAQQLTDSAVASMVQVYLDAMAKEQTANPTALPSWTTKIGGKTVGLDSKWIYLGPIKIPTALLALLPINLNGNMSDYQYNKSLQQMRSDLFEAARRSATYDDFKQSVKDLHDQTEQAREFRKNRQTAPDTGHHG
ncbi:MAG: hypothetical protein ABUL71_03140 [Gemmatimonadota bacterium]